MAVDTSRPLRCTLCDTTTRIQYTWYSPMVPLRTPQARLSVQEAFDAALLLRRQDLAERLRRGQELPCSTCLRETSNEPQEDQPSLWHLRAPDELQKILLQLHGEPPCLTISAQDVRGHGLVRVGDRVLYLEAALHILHDAHWTFYRREPGTSRMLFLDDTHQVKHRSVADALAGRGRARPALLLFREHKGDELPLHREVEEHQRQEQWRRRQQHGSSSKRRRLDSCGRGQQQPPRRQSQSACS